MAEPIVSVELDLDSKNFDKELDAKKSKIERTGKEAGDRFSKSFGGNIFGGLTRQIAILGATVAGALSFREAIRGAIDAQNSLNAFNRSLALTGQFSEKASLSFQQYADSIENTSAVSADATLSAASLIQSIGKLDVASLKPATQAALDLSAALGVNLETAARLVGRAANGEVESFKKFGLEIQKGTTDSQTFANALTAINTAFGGANAGSINTFAGQLTRLQNAFGAVLEEFGKAIVDSPVIIALLKTLGDEFFKLKGKVEKLNLSSVFSIDGIIKFGAAVNEFVIAPLELVFNFAKIIFNGINTIVAGSVALIGQKVGFIGDLLNKIGVDNGLTQAFQTFRESSAEVFTGVALDTKEAVDGLFDGTVFGKGEAFLENLRVNLESAKGQIESSGIKNAITPPVTTEGGGSFLDSFLSGFTQAEITLANFAEKTKAFGQQIRNNLQAGIANGAGQAFAQFGQALATGNNALEAFAKAFISSIGQIAIQQGSAFILQGLAYQFVPGFQATGSALIGAGAALAAFGGALTAFSGGGAGGGSPTAANGGDTIGGQSIADPRTGLASSQERVEPSTAVTVNIQGDVFDSEETGLRISNILKESSLNNNVRASVFA